MAGEEDEILGRLALERGLLTAEQIREALKAQAREPEKRLSDILGELGLVDDETLASLVKECRDVGAPTFVEGRDAHFECRSCKTTYRIHEPKAGHSYRCKRCSGVLAEAAPPKPKSPERQFGRYTIVGELGRGGMGVVYKAWDPGRDAHVAIKCMLGSDRGEEVKRFLREASTSSDLDHPNIVQVFEVDEVDGTPYIAMEYVEGPSFARLLKPKKKEEKRIPLRRAIEIVRDVARALDYAHGRGIVHRDIKPENIMLDAQDRVRVMDFGLAREIARGATVTASGAVIGTPVYMSPEQATGRKDLIDGRSDLWALGIMLYEAAAERPPFLGDTPAEILHRVIHEEPATLRRRADRDLDTIVMKCLEWETHRRYPTAGALADDLDRYLDRRPILARPVSLAYKLKRRLGKRKGVVAAVAGGILALAALAAILVPRLGKARQEAAAEKERSREARKAALDQLRQTTETALTAAIGFRQMGRIPDMDRFLRQTEDACRKAIADLPEEPEPHYRLGRMYRARMDDARALEEQQRALAKDASFAPSRYERVVLNARLYRERLRQLEQEARIAEGRRAALRAGGTVEAGTVSEIPPAEELAKGDPRASDLLSTIESDLRFLAGASLPEAQALCAKGLLARISGDLDGAREHLGACLSKDPAVEEACEALATIESEARRFEEALRWWNRGCEIDRGYVPYLEGRGQTRHGWSMTTGSIEKCEEAIADFTAAIQLAPERAMPRLKRGLQRGTLAMIRLGKGEKPTDLYRAAVEDFTDALARDPRCVEALLVRGLHRINLAEIEAESGRPVDALLDEAEADLKAALALDAQNAQAWGLLCMNHGMRALMLRASGADPGPFLRAGIEDAGEALKCEPSDAATWSQRAMLRTALAAWTVEQRTGDWDSLYAGADADFRQAMALAPKDWELAMFAAQAGWKWSVQLWNTGDRRLDRLEGVIANWTKVVEHRPSHARAWGDRGAAKYTLAQIRRKLDSGADIAESIRSALRDFDQAASLDPSFRSAYAKWADDCRAYLKSSEK